MKEQVNVYAVVYSCGTASKTYINASNIKQAYELAKKKQADEKLNFGNYWKLKRVYNGGVRG